MSTLRCAFSYFNISKVTLMQLANDGRSTGSIFFPFLVGHKIIVYLAIDSFTLDEIVLISLHFISISKII